MEFERSSVKECPEHQRLPTEFWNILHKSILELLNNGKNIVPQLDQIIQPCKNHHEYYVPPKFGQQAEYEAKLPHYIGFTTWLLGQIVRATTVSELECHHQQLIGWQVTIIDLLAYRNQFMFSVVLSEYLTVIKDLVGTRCGKEGPFEFTWFHRANVDSQPPLDKFILCDTAACGVLLSYLLKVMRPHTLMLASCNPSGMSYYWKALLPLLVDSDVQVLLAALDSVTTNIKCDDFPSKLHLIYDLCESLSSKLSRLRLVGCYPEAILESTNAFFETVVGHFKTADKKALSCLYLALLSLLEPKNPILCSGITSRALCKLIILMSRGCRVSADIKSKILPLLKHAAKFPDILLIVESLVWDDLQLHSNVAENMRPCKELSSLWVSVVEVATETVEALRSRGHGPDSARQLVRLVSSVTLAAANVSSRHSSPVVFFGNRFYQNWNKLLRETDLNVAFIYLEVVKASKYLTSLPDMAVIDLKEANSLLAFLSVPWLNCKIAAQLPQVDMAPYYVMADLEIFLDDPAVTLESLEGLTVMAACGSLSLDWRLAVLSQAAGGMDEAALLDTVCAMLTTLPQGMRPRVLTALINPLFSTKNEIMLPHLAEKFPVMACALAGTTELVRNSRREHYNKSELYIRCKICDDKINEEPKYIEDDLAAATLETYLQLRFNKSSPVRKQVAGSLRRWSKHIPEPILRQHVEKWLRYIKDESHEVRMAMADNAAHLVSADSSASFIGLYRQVMLTLIHQSLAPADHHLQLSLMITAHNIGCQPFENILLPTLEMFVPLISHPLSLHGFPALVNLNKIATARGKTVQDLFFRFQDEIFKYFALLLIMNSLENLEHTTTMLVKLARAFSFPDTKELWDLSGCKYLLKHLLPLITRNPRAKEMLTPIAAAALSDVSTILKDSFAYVYPHVLLFEDKATQDKVHQLIEASTELSIQSLICFSFKVVICELLLYYHMEKAKVTEALRSLKDCDYGSASTSESMIFSSNNKPDSPNIDITQFLQPRFLAVLAYLDGILVTQSCCESTKRHALLTLPELIKLMGVQHITPVRFKVLATLRYALNLYHSYFPQLICFAWRAFVQNVSSLGPLLSAIFVSLLPLLDQYPVEICSVFRILVVDNLEAVREHLAELYFLPDTPATHQIYTLVQAELEKLRKLPVKDQLAVTLRLATHENADVRLRGLHKLRDDLSFHRENLVSLISAHDNIDPFILKLLEALLSGCQDPDVGVRLASAQCLGELGALDPGRLPNRFKIEVEEKEMFVINSEAFVLRALNEFVRAFQAASHTTTMDVFAFGIQELLKMYNVPQSAVWDQLSDATKEIISPFRESHYKRFTDTADNHPHIPHPIFGTNFGSSLKLWAWNWVSRLIPSVTDEFVRKVFSVCLLGLKKDLQSLLFFLPYIVLHAILGATKTQSRRIAEEINAVLFHRGDDQPTPDTPRSIPSSGSLQSTQVTQDETHTTQALCAKTVYQLLDFLYHWLRQTKQKVKSAEDSSIAQQYNTLKEFLTTFSKKDIADGSFRCKEYTRALLFLEEYMNENPDLVQSYLPYLGKIYYHLHDPDSFKGIIAIREEEPTAQEMILYHKLTGKLQDAAACYERLVQLHESDTSEDEDVYKGMVQCYLGMDQPSTALQLTKGFLNSVDRWRQCGDMVDEQAEAMLALSMFPQLEQLLSTSGATTTTAGGDGWGTALGHALLHLSRGSQAEMAAVLDRTRGALVRNLAGCSLTKSTTEYRHGYDVVVKLHILSELEKVGNMVLKSQGRSVKDMESLFKQVVKELDDRLKVVQPSYRVLQPVLCVRRVVLSLARDIGPQIQSLVTTEIGNSWLKSIEIARKSGHYQQAYTNILTVEPFKPKGLFLEKARLLWAKSETEAALNTLKRGVERNFPNMEPLKQTSSGSVQCSGNNNTHMDERRLCAEAYLLIAQYNDKNANIDMDTNIKNYKKAVAICPMWEKSCVCLAQCYYKYLRTTTLLAHQLECQIHLINMFGKSLQYGCEYIYQSMPRMLSTWLDFGTQLAQDVLSSRAPDGLTERKSAMDKMTGLIEAFSKRLPTYMFMTAFSQIISRICHPQKGCYNILKAIIIKIIIAYPQQALWMFLSVYKSPYTDRVKRCEEVLKSGDILRRTELNRTINDFRELFHQLIELGAKRVEGKNTTTVYIRSFMRSLYNLVSNPGFGRVVIPLQRFRTISLPRTTTEYHNPFPEDLVYICGMKEEVAIVSSLQRPKRISFIGTDGKQYSLLCKPNDDLRLDSRMMEFNSIVNMYLQRDPEARERGLYIRTYSAVPLSDTSGIIEWVPNLIGLRQILNTAYKQTGVAMNNKELKDLCTVLASKSESVAKKRSVFVDKLLPRHPPMLREWYLREFSHPTAWYLARTAYVHTLAVMSIVGFMLGLGDRHGENILIDSTCGDVFHVDFNCLFNKGERFDVPEKVPFRLTHNLTHAMGPTGVEGMFRHSCEITTRVMRQQIDQLMSVVRPFCYDPLVTWNTNKNRRDENAEMTNEKAMEDIQNIEMRLQGIVKTKSGSYSVPLSVEGQVRILIAEATDINNLCQMYPGWGPFL